MNEMCGDNRFEIIEKAKKDILEATNINTSPDEMKVLDSFLFRCWQMGWIKDAEPVRHGRWEWFEEWSPSTPEHPKELDDCGWRCSECKTALADVVGGYWDNSYEPPKIKRCPECGARMGGERYEGSMQKL